MEWTDIHDPSGEVDFYMEWTLVGGQYTPEEIQKMIDDSGVLGMVHTVNEHFKLISGHTAMIIGWVGGHKAVVQA